MDLFLQQSVNGLVLGGAYVLVALGLYLIFNTMHIPNFAHGEMFALGSYFQYSFVVLVGVPFFVALPLTVVAVAVVGAILERLVFRRLKSVSTLAILVGSLALATVIQELLMLIWGKDALSMASPFDGSVTLGPVTVSSYRLFIVVAAIVISVLVGFTVYRTSYGRDLRALAQNAEIAELAGINVRRLGTITFALGSGVAGIAGALMAPATTVQPLMGFQPSLMAFVILVIVGAGARLKAVVLTGVIIALIETRTAGYITTSARQIVIFLGLVLFLMIRPEGAVRQNSMTKVTL